MRRVSKRLSIFNKKPKPAVVNSGFVTLPANAKIDVNNAMAREFSAYPAVRKSTSASGRPGGIIYYSGRLDAARECLASSHEAS